MSRATHAQVDGLERLVRMLATENENLKQRLQALEAAQRWVSVAERLPEVNQWGNSNRVDVVMIGSEYEGRQLFLDEPVVEVGQLLKPFK